MMNKGTLANIISIITFLFSLFGNFLLNIAPPKEGGIGFATGISFLIAVLSLILVRVLIKQFPADKYKTTWLITGIVSTLLFITSIVFYQMNFSRYTYTYPEQSASPKRFTGGTSQTETANAYVKANPLNTVAHMVADLGGPDKATGIIWGGSHQKADLLLTWLYVPMALFFFIGIFSFVEGGLRETIPGQEEDKKKEE